MENCNRQECNFPPFPQSAVLASAIFKMAMLCGDAASVAQTKGNRHSANGGVICSGILCHFENGGNRTVELHKQGNRHSANGGVICSVRQPDPLPGF